MLRNAEVKDKIESLESKVNSLKGKVDLLSQQIGESSIRQKELQNLKIVNEKGIELLHFVKKVTEEYIKNLFEKIVSEALSYIYQNNDYKFELEFGRRGALPELKFNLKRPELKESHNILHTSAGGSRDVVALALRFVILETAKINGFLFLDEIEKRLDSPETISRMIQFIKEMQEKTGRQIIIITHKQEFVDAVPTPIIFKNNNAENIQKCIVKETKKRGRKKKNA
jgi:DNA repair exonuclease SbcCD ATPase subunit